MSEKTLNTRLINKNGTLAEWSSSTLALKKGEIALAKIETTTTNPVDGSIVHVPAYVMKVGVDGVKKFSDAAWLYAPASDVHAWAKNEKLAYADLPTELTAEIDNLQEAIGSNGSVAGMIATAIDALDSTETGSGTIVKAVTQTNGKVAVTMGTLAASEIPQLEISKINGLQDALNAKAATSDVNASIEILTQADTALDERIDDIETSLATGGATANAIAAAKKAGDDAQGYAEGVAGDLADEISTRKAADEGLDERIDDIETSLATGGATANAIAAAKKAGDDAQADVDALEGTVNTLSQTVATNKSDAATAVANEKAAREEADNALDDRIEVLEGQVSSLNSATTLEGVNTLANRPATGKAAGAIYIATDNNKEYVWDGSKWVELGDTTAELSEINGLKGRMTTAEGDITGLKAADENLDGRITTLSQTHATDKAALEKAIEDAITEVKKYADDNDANTVYNDTEVRGLIAAEAEAREDADITLQNNINQKADSSTVITLSNTVSGHTTSITDLQATVSGHTGDISQLQTAVGKKAESSALEALETKVNNNETDIEGKMTALTARVGTAETDIDGLQATVGGHTTSIGTINTELAKKALGSDLTALSGRVEAIEADYLKSTDVLILDCGGVS